MSIIDKFEKLDLFHPLILVAIIILFVLIAIPSWTILDEIIAPYPQLYGYIFIGLFFFISGILVVRFLFNNSKLSPKYLYLIREPKIPNKLSLFGKYSKSELIIVGIVLLGILLQIINLINLGGIPLFSSILKAKAATKIWLISYILFLPSINILLAKFNRKSHYFLLIIGLVLFALTGYRTTPIAIVLSSFITLYYTRDFKLKYQILFFVIIACLLIVIGFIAVSAIGTQHWRLNPIELVSYRAGFTLKILDRVINRQLITGGSLFYATLTGFFNSVDPRVLVGEAVLSQSHSITSTIFGPVLLDFGIIGMIIQMFFLGVFLKILHILQKYKTGILTGIYGVILAQTLIWVETGPTDIVVWLFYLIGFVILIVSLLKLESKVKNFKG